MTDEKFVKSIYPNAVIQPTFGGARVCSEPTIKGRWVGFGFPKKARNPWHWAAEHIRAEMLRKLES